LLIVSAVLDVAVMTVLLRDGERRPLRSLHHAASFMISALPRLARFALGLLLRVLMIAAPFLCIGVLIAAALIRDYDINYYLTNRPPAFLVAVGLILAVALVMAGCLVARLTGWAISLHLSLHCGMGVRQAFDESRLRMKGHRRKLLSRLFCWFVLRAVAVAMIASLAGILVSHLPELVGNRMQVIAVTMAIVGLFWSAANAMLSSLANGALAHILNQQFKQTATGRGAGANLTPGSEYPARLSPTLGVVAITGVLSVASLGTGGLLLETFEAKEEIAVIGHRGAAALRPENTMASILKAIEDGADWIEIDVQETADGEVIVAHDSDFMKAAGVPTKIWDATMADIDAIDIGSWYDPAYRDERAPLLRDVLAAVKGQSKLLIELKYYGHDEDLENRVVTLVEEAGMVGRIATMSLKYPAVQKMHRLRPEWPTGVLAATAVGDLAGLDGDFLAVNTSQISSRLISQAGAAGKDVYVWTVNDPGMMSRMISLGVDGLITDDPALARDVIDYYQSLPTAGRLLLALGDRAGVAFDLDRPEELRP
ncbi:MAG: glycerophosphodiester phosphodiesterase family protein, partial [Pseudomonadota bacterium]